VDVNSQRSWAWIAASACLLVAIPPAAQAQQPKLRATVGAYYFDGWSGKTEDMHLPKLLQTKYADRKPIWGWRDDTAEIMRQQIDLCADHGIAFWAFDWYYPEGKDKATPLNNALGLYLKAPNCQRLKFCLLVANHAGFRIGPKDWDACCQKWIDLFRQPTHLQLDGQPLLIFFSPEELQRAFGGVEGVRQAFDSLRAKAKQAGLPGVTVAACTGPGKHLADLARSGEDVGLVSRPHTQAGRGVRPPRRPVAGPASRQGHESAAPPDLRLERKWRRRIPDADCQGRHRVPEGGPAGNPWGTVMLVWGRESGAAPGKP
jgi:hypothetical protein